MLDDSDSEGEGDKCWCVAVAGPCWMGEAIHSMKLNLTDWSSQRAVLWLNQRDVQDGRVQNVYVYIFVSVFGHTSPSAHFAFALACPPR
jgi:hypothetical protein